MSTATVRVKPRPSIVVGLISVLAFPQLAWANAGTPMLWATLGHLLVGNAFIGLLEGALLGWLFGVATGRAAAIMVLANYVSAWLGGVILSGAIASALPADLTNGWAWLWFMVALTYVITLLIEWPFVVWCLRGTSNKLRRSLRGSLLVQSTSYLLLFGWYWLASDLSLYTKIQVVRPEALALPEGVQVYFIATSDGSARRRGLRGQGDRKILDLDSTDANDRLFARPSAFDTNRWDLVARLETGDRRNPRFVPVLTNLQVQAVPDPGSLLRTPPVYEGTWFNFGKAPKLGTAANSQWSFWAGFWPTEGLRAANEATHRFERFGYETPLFPDWAVRNVVQLPSDLALFQLGRDQICVFDPVSGRVALLWHGRGPVAVIEKPETGISRSPAEGSR